jgi:quinol-cytochrome oxidoreductase complex cytochrome b subunit
VNTRNVILVIVFLFIVGFGYLTLAAVADQGVNVYTLISLLVLALFGFGIVGALRHPPDE